MRAALAAVLLSLTLIPVSPPAAATAGTIQPGDFMTTAGLGCTMNFVFDGVGALAGKVYVGTAAHCVAKVGDSVSSTPYANFGTVAIIGDAGAASTDWAFVEVKPAFTPFVKAWVKGHPQYPTGIATLAERAPGDLVQFSGYGTGFSTTTATQEKRVGVLGQEQPHQVQVIGPVLWGDSGGPIVHIPTGKALSLQSRLCVVWACTEVGPSFEHLLAQAAARGFTVQIRTV